MTPELRLLADRVASRLRAKSRPGRTVTVRVRFGDLRSVTRSVTLDAPISATVVLSEIGEELVRKVLAQHPDEKTISLVAIFVSQLEKLWDVQLELPLGLEDEERRPGSKIGMIEFSTHKHLKTVQGQVLSENTTMLAMCAELGFHIADDPDEPGVKTVTLPVRTAHRDANFG